MKVRFLGAHNSESRNTGYVSILIDDVIVVDAGSLTSQLTFSEQKKIKAILITHGHYDHIRDIPAFAFNNRDHVTRVFAPSQTLKIISSHLIDGIIYPKFTKKIPFFLEKPSIKFVALEPFNPLEIEDYQVLAIPVNHTIYAVGYEISDKNGNKIFYSGDTGPGLSTPLEHISPNLIIVDLTFPNRFENRAINSAHLCPKMLKKELLEFYHAKGYYPRVFAIHLSSKFENEIKKDIKIIEKDLDITIEIAQEGKELII